MSPMHQSRYKSYFPIMLIGFIMLMVFSKGWILWPMLFFLGWAFFSKKGGYSGWQSMQREGKQWGGWWCDSDSGDISREKAKRKNEDLYAEFENSEKPKREGEGRDKRYIQTPDGEWIEIV